MKRDEEVISRAYWKMLEALTWSQLPVVRGDKCVEIGSAPGGASQALLRAGLHVTGIDPAEMDEELLEHPRFTHVKKRAGDMKRREFRGVRWLMADSNVVPDRTLAMVEDIVTHREVNVRGLLLTLKLPEWDLAEHIPEYVARVRSWGFRYVRTRQLAFNRQEICLAALRDRTLRRAPRTKRARRPSTPPAGSQSDEA
jgi:23S rRNA (cytidine2498-2'-O)-methyltransferase